ncbi:MAG TPA: His-Xaa-Ser system radical SAM maturase HxsC [Puia sp.]|jgi:His-Xaa-Ser system radical SAM maturase HxsC
MLLRIKGKAINFDTWLVGRVTRDINAQVESYFLLCEDEVPDAIPNCFVGVLSTVNLLPSFGRLPVIAQIASLDHLDENDIVVAFPNGMVNTLYRVNSYHNTILATERCNSNCLMCSQPPKDKDDIIRQFLIYRQAIPLIPKNCIELGISGGEPTLMGELFFELLRLLKEQLPDTELHVLTNGRSFAWEHLAARMGAINHRGLMLGIPLYSDYYQIHDYIVQAKDAFSQTLLGLHQLARYQQRIEIRVVLHQQTIPRLTRLARYIYKNLPFIEHVAFMGLEHIGYTPHNSEVLWIDPVEYAEQLGEAVQFLAGQGMRVSIYNAQLCTLPQKLWPYCRKSISDWKNSYLAECSRCIKRSDCGGFFTWNLQRTSRSIKAID